MLVFEQEGESREKNQEKEINKDLSSEDIFGKHIPMVIDEVAGPWVGNDVWVFAIDEFFEKVVFDDVVIVSKKNTFGNDAMSDIVSWRKQRRDLGLSFWRGRGSAAGRLRYVGRERKKGSVFFEPQREGSTSRWFGEVAWIFGVVQLGLAVPFGKSAQRSF